MNMTSLAFLPLTGSWKQEREVIESLIRPRIQDGLVLQILEAGCGRQWGLNLGSTGYRLTGVDLDGDALRARLEVSKDLDKAVVGDLRTVDLEPAEFDVIYNSYVLEHIPDAERVLINFCRWLKPRGLIVIRIPDPFSVYGFMARVTPHWFHVFYYRWIVGFPNAGKPGYGPYPVYYDKVVSREGIRRFCEQNQLSLVAEYGTGGYYQRGTGISRWVLFVFRRAIGLLSLRKLSGSHDNLLYILSKD
jgi:SAM-dependent methyltransferase